MTPVILAVAAFGFMMLGYIIGRNDVTDIETVASETYDLQQDVIKKLMTHIRTGKTVQEFYELLDGDKDFIDYCNLMKKAKEAKENGKA